MRAFFNGATIFGRLICALSVVSFCTLICAGDVHAEDYCLYRDSKGKTVQVRGRDNVPSEFLPQARCLQLKRKEPVLPAKGAELAAGILAAPGAVSLAGTLRHEDMASSVGRIALRWPRRIESLFGRTPQRAMADAARAVSRALKSAGFPAQLQSLELDWQVVFMDANLPETQIPPYLINNCHPAWMTPPANLYFVAQRIVGGCSPGARLSSSVADAELAHIIMHEMGHAVEHQLLGKYAGAFADDRERAEGFASWFEQYAAQFSAVVPKGVVQAGFVSLAREGLRTGRWPRFSGDAASYASAALMFMAIEERRGVPALMQVYKAMREQGISFQSALENRLGWSSERLHEEARRLVFK